MRAPLRNYLSPLGWHVLVIALGGAAGAWACWWSHQPWSQP